MVIAIIILLDKNKRVTGMGGGFVFERVEIFRSEIGIDLFLKNNHIFWNGK